MTGKEIFSSPEQKPEGKRALPQALAEGGPLREVAVTLIRKMYNDDTLDWEGDRMGEIAVSLGLPEHTSFAEFMPAFFVFEQELLPPGELEALKQQAEAGDWDRFKKSSTDPRDLDSWKTPPPSNMSHKLSKDNIEKILEDSKGWVADVVQKKKE